MSPRLLLGVIVVLAVVMSATADRPAAQSIDLTRHIDSLSVFDDAALETERAGYAGDAIIERLEF